MWGSLGGGAVCQCGSMEGMHVGMFFSVKRFSIKTGPHLVSRS